MFREYFLIEADSFASAARKSNHILSVHENESGSASLNDLPVSFRQLGILDLEPITSEIVSGADISETGVSLADARRLILSDTARTARERYEQEHGMPPVLPVFWGDEFDGL